jgi:DNA repair exonuclease SbcCD ATPase subunit
MRQIAEGNAKLHKTEKIVRDPQELKRHMEEQLQSVDEKIAELKKRLSVLQAESAAREADRAVAERDRKLQNDTVETKTSDLERARIKAKGRVDELPEKTDFESFLRNGPGPPPDPWGPNQMREVWLKWRAKKEAYDTARGFIAPATKELEAAKKQFDNLSKSFKTATLACEKIRKSIDAKESELNLKLNDRQAAEHMLNTTLVEADAAAVKNLSEIRRKIRESEATKAVLLLQNIPTILALLLVSISALVRLALLRGRFKPRALIHS